MLHASLFKTRGHRILEKRLWRLRKFQGKILRPPFPPRSGERHLPFYFILFLYFRHFQVRTCVPFLQVATPLLLRREQIAGIVWLFLRILSFAEWPGRLGRYLKIPYDLKQPQSKLSDHWWLWERREIIWNFYFKKKKNIIIIVAANRRRKVQQRRSSMRPNRKHTLAPLAAAIRSMWNQLYVGFCWGGKTGKPGDKPSNGEKRTNTNSTPFGAGSGNRTWATLVGGECSHHCVIPAHRLDTLSSLAISWQMNLNLTKCEASASCFETAC